MKVPSLFFSRNVLKCADRESRKPECDLHSQVNVVLMSRGMLYMNVPDGLFPHEVYADELAAKRESEWDGYATIMPTLFLARTRQRHSRTLRPELVRLNESKCVALGGCSLAKQHIERRPSRGILLPKSNMKEPMGQSRKRSFAKDMMGAELQGSSRKGSVLSGLQSHEYSSSSENSNDQSGDLYLSLNPFFRGQR